jgi:diguanylate cyclase (GGDEF)-like protein
MNSVPKANPYREDVLNVVRATFEDASLGIVLIDPDLIVRFVNAKARDLWRLPPEQYDCNPPLSKYLFNIAAAGAYDVNPDVLEEYVLSRFASIQSGDATPEDIRIVGNRIVRAQCSPLPDGCRLVTYTEVGDLVLRADALQQLVNIDSLTDLPNRAEFLRQGEAEWYRFRRYHHCFSVAVLDIGNIDTINADRGIDVRNRAILHVAAICLREVRLTDIVARLGAVRFAVLMPNTSATEAQAFADRLCTAVTCCPLYLEERPLALTPSVGVAQSEAEMSGIAALLKAAGEKLRVANDMHADRTPRHLSVVQRN